MTACLFMGGVADGQRIETDGSPEWLVPHPSKPRSQAIPDVPNPEVLIRLAIRHDQHTHASDRYQRHEWVEFGQPAEYRYVFVGRQ